MHFHPLSLGLIETVRPYFQFFSSKTCDYTVGGMFMWRDYYNMEYALEGGSVFTRLTDKNGKIYYNLPFDACLDKALQHLKQEEQKRGSSEISFCTIPEDYIKTVSKIFINPQVIEQPNFADYLYFTKDLVELKGRKYSGQRNLINQFNRHVDKWSFSQIDSTNIWKVTDFFHRYRSAVDYDSEFAYEENRMVEDVIQHLDTYGFIGGVLEADGNVAGFAFGELINRTLFTHIEKADRNFPGAYQMLVNQFACAFADGKVEFINREEDMGDLGLRRSKCAYHPKSKLKKYIVEGMMV